MIGEYLLQPCNTSQPIIIRPWDFCTYLPALKLKETAPLKLWLLHVRSSLPFRSGHTSGFRADSPDVRCFVLLPAKGGHSFVLISWDAIKRSTFLWAPSNDWLQAGSNEYLLILSLVKSVNRVCMYWGASCHVHCRAQAPAVTTRKTHPHSVLLLLLHCNWQLPKQKAFKAFSPEWTKEHGFIRRNSQDDFHIYCLLCCCDVDVDGHGTQTNIKLTNMPQVPVHWKHFDKRIHLLKVKKNLCIVLCKLYHAVMQECRLWRKNWQRNLQWSIYCKKDDVEKQKLKLCARAS